MHTYDLSARSEQPSLCPCQMGYATEPTGLCKVCLDLDARQRDAVMRDLESARRAASHGAWTARDAFDTFVVVVLVLGIVGMFIAILWLQSEAKQKGNAMASYGAQGWEAGR